jgi:predicted transcriptional regulator
MPVPYQILNAVWNHGEVDLTNILAACDTQEKKDLAAQTLDVLRRNKVIEQVHRNSNLYRYKATGNVVDYYKLLPQKAS